MLGTGFNSVILTNLMSPVDLDGYNELKTSLICVSLAKHLRLHFSGSMFYP
jgi:hypothetical protein